MDNEKLVKQWVLEGLADDEIQDKLNELEKENDIAYKASIEEVWDQPSPAPGPVNDTIQISLERTWASISKLYDDTNPFIWRNGTNQSMAYGYGAGVNQGGNAVSIGRYAGHTTQGANSFALGANAGERTQGANSIAMGVDCGRDAQGTESIALGHATGKTNQGDYAIAIGNLTAITGQPTKSIAIGTGNTTSLYAKPDKEGDIVFMTSHTSNSNDNKFEIKDGKAYVNGTEIGANTGQDPLLTQLGDINVSDSRDLSDLPDDTDQTNVLATEKFAVDTAQDVYDAIDTNIDVKINLALDKTLTITFDDGTTADYKVKNG